MFDLEHTKAQLERAIAERGADWVYPVSVLHPENDSFLEDDWHLGEFGTCRYRKPDGSPACGVGVVLFYDDLLEDAEEERAAVELRVVEENYDYESVRLLTAFQEQQDAGTPWGEAYEAALKVALDSNEL